VSEGLISVGFKTLFLLLDMFVTCYFTNVSGRLIMIRQTSSPS